MREKALAVLKEYNESEALIRHGCHGSGAKNISGYFPGYS